MARGPLSDSPAHPSTAPHETLSARTPWRALILGALLVLGLIFLMPYVNLSLNKYDWAFRPLALGPLFVLCLLAWPVNAALRRLRPRWALRAPELLLAYAMMAISAALAGEGLFVYAIVNAVHPQFYATPGNRWVELMFPHLPDWLLLHRRDAINWFYDAAPPGASLPWGEWVSPVVAWAIFAFGLYVGLFSLAALLRKDWIEAQRLAFPLAAVPVDIAADGAAPRPGALLRNPLLWAGFLLPAGQSLLQMAHAFSPAVPYSPLYWPLSTAFGAGLPWSAIDDTTVYIGFETIGILALVPAEVTLSLWFFFLVNRLELVAFAALGFGREGVGASLFSPRAFVSYQSAGACFMLAALVLWQSRRSIAAALRSLLGGPAQRDPLSPLSPRAAALGLVLSATITTLWAHRTGLELWAFAALMAVFTAFSLVIGRLVAAGGIFAPAIGMNPTDVLTGLAGATRFSPTSLTMMVYTETTLMQEWKVNFFHFAMNDLKITHAAGIPGRIVTPALALSIALMLAIVPWVILHAAYAHGAFHFNTWQFQDRQTYAYNALVSDLHSPRGPAPYLPLGLLCGAAAMLALNWLHTSFLWWAISPLGFVMSDTYFMNARIWPNAFIAWLLVWSIRRFGGLRLYRRVRPAFLGMILGHFIIFGVRSLLDPALGLHMHLSAWE